MDNKSVHLTVDAIKSMAESGKCLCGWDHKLELCGFMMKAGYLIDHDPAKALAKWSRVDPNKTTSS